MWLIESALIFSYKSGFSGFTHQYLDFNPLLQRHRDDDVHMLAFPSNQFDLQEPGKNSEILNGLKYVRPGGGFEPDRNLHIFGKLDVNGGKEHPMFTWLKVGAFIQIVQHLLCIHFEKILTFYEKLR